MKRMAVFIAMVAVLAPSPALAHGTGDSSGGSGISLPLLLGGIALAAAALATRGRIAAAGTWAAVTVGIALAAASLFVGGDDGSRPDVHVAVVEPANGDTVAAGQPIMVRVSVDGPLAASPEDSDGGHLHLSVDGQLQQMPYTATAEVTLEPGRHTVTVEYVDHQHLSYDPPIQQSVEVTAR